MLRLRSIHQFDLAVTPEIFWISGPFWKVKFMLTSLHGIGVRA